jgi:Zn finger protein HypA/HybF involved in hydrogenase expression
MSDMRLTPCEHEWKQRRGYFECARCGRNETPEWREMMRRARPLKDGVEPALDDPTGLDVCCEKCGSTNLDLDGWDIDKCRECGHWRYR